MSDAEWAFFEPFVVETGPRRGRRPRDHRPVRDGVFWIARTGTAWRDLPSHFGTWNSVYRQFQRWTQAGIWDVMLSCILWRTGYSIAPLNWTGYPKRIEQKSFSAAPMRSSGLSTLVAPFIPIPGMRGYCRDRETFIDHAKPKGGLEKP